MIFHFSYLYNKLPILCKAYLSYAYLHNSIRLQEEREKMAQLRGPPNIDPEEAATKIQKVIVNHLFIVGDCTDLVDAQTWRGVYQRKKIAQMRQEELLFIGMV